MSLLDSWPTPAARAKHQAALDRLRRLQLLLPACSKEAPDASLDLHPAFREQLRWAVTTSQGKEGSGVPAAVLEAAPSRADLDQHASRQWEALMLYLVGSAEQPPAASPLLPPAVALPLDELLSAAGLLSLAQRERSITEQGFQFLLLDTYGQLWLLLREYIASANARFGEPLGEVLNFLLQLGFREVGAPFAASALRPSERGIAADLAQLGLLLPFRATGGMWLAPTRLAQALASGGGGEAVGEVSEGFIVVETNYRVYAYTSSALQAAILRLFVRCECVLPNLFVGVLTRESVTGALGCGLSADQIVDFLRKHAHPHIAQRVPVVPETVADQIRLWQADTRRVRQSRAYLYEAFDSPAAFAAAAAHARAAGTWLWQDDAKGRLVAAYVGHDAMRAFIRANR
ncbi:hypothetical protein WJX81_001241 [Elliptochloris bilobata]|uniref:RNA polymerase II transcription factor B subunit 2 n=1 Tax=Elliptochloris bilobata TaxID=381761 RepID=A0AAW1R2H2_9CHLO